MTKQASTYKVTIVNKLHFGPSTYFFDIDASTRAAVAGKGRAEVNKQSKFFLGGITVEKRSPASEPNREIWILERA